MLKSLMFKSGLAAFACSISICAYAMADTPKQVDVPAGDLASALEMISKQAGVELVFNPEQLRGLSTKGVTGKLSSQDAVKKLIEGTPLQLRTDNATGAMMIGTPAPVAPPKSTSATSESRSISDATAPTKDKASPSELSKRSLFDRFRVAQVDQGHSASDSSVETQAEGASHKKPLQLEEVLVTGSRIPLAAKEHAQPVLVFTAKDIEDSGRATVADFFNTLPQVSMNSVTGNQQSFAGQTGIYLHGLPLGATLLLIDGQSTQLSRYGNLDLGVIPAAAIERIEIIPVGSSAIYGSSALAGVVNIVMKKNLDGADLDVKYGFADNYNTNTVNAAVGKDWGPGSASVVVSHQRQSGLEYADRALSAMGDYRSLGGADQRYAACNPGTVYGLNGANLPGLNASKAAIPAGLTGTPTISNFAATAGQENKCNYFSSSDLISPSNQTGLIANARYEVTPGLELFASLLYSHYQSDSATGTLLSFASPANVVSAANPYNPFGQDVGIGWSYGAQDYQRRETFVRPVFGVRGDIGSGWHYEVTTLYSHDNFDVHQTVPDARGIRAALGSSDPATALNVFTSGAPGSPALINSLYDSVYNHYRDGLISAQAILRGPLFNLPTGAVQGVFGADYERSSIWYQAAAYGSTTLPPPGDTSRNAYALFTEERVPLIGNGTSLGGADRLALSLAGRYDHSNDFGNKATYQGGLEWRPVASLLLRGAFGTSYRAPALPLLYGSTTSNLTATVVDPYRGNTSYLMPYTSGPNPALQPETGRSRSLGAVYSTGSSEGLEASLTYWSIDYNEYIGQVNVNDLIAYPQDYPAQFVTRAAPTAADLAKGWLGAVTSIYGTSVNYGSITVAGFDLDAKYRIRTGMGTWTPAVAVTQTFKYEVALRPSQPQQSYVSQAVAAPGWAPRWKGNLSLSWEKGSWSASTTGRYISSYNDYVAYAAGLPLPHELGNFWLFDANVRFDIGRSLAEHNRWLRNSSVAVGGTNIFNRPPQFSYYAHAGYDISQGDILGRMIYLQGQLKF